MDIKLRGWGRDMGTDTLVEIPLSEMEVREDENRPATSSQPRLFKEKRSLAYLQRVYIAWKQQLNRTGNFRMEMMFRPGDVARLFRAMFGSEITSQTLERTGLTISPELKKKLIGEIKLSDLTIGDLAGLAATPKAEPEPAATPPVRIGLRRV